MARTRRTPAITAGLGGALFGFAPAPAYAVSMAELAANPLVTFGAGFVCGALVLGAGTVLVRTVSSHVSREDDFVIPQGSRRASAIADDEDFAAFFGSEPVVPSADDGSTEEYAPLAPRHFSQAAVAAAEKAEAEEEKRKRRFVFKREEEPEINILGAEPLNDAGHEATDYADIAENYVRRLTWRERMASRTRGVREMLNERMGEGMFDDLPIIERADGTVGDVGTGWWDARLGNSVRHDFGFAAEEAQADMTAASTSAHFSGKPSSNLGGRLPEERVVSASRVQAQANPVGSVPNRQTRAGEVRSSLIARSVAPVEQGNFPAHRRADELDHDDLWEMALAALDERLNRMERDAKNGPVFVDVVGGVESIDDPAGLDNPTSFLHFRVPAGHPKVVDTETYVDYLIEDEFANNTSQVARKSSRNYLRLIEGGSQPMKKLGSDKTAQAPRPKHMRKPKRLSEMVDANMVRKAAGEN